MDKDLKEIQDDMEKIFDVAKLIEINENQIEELEQQLKKKRIVIVNENFYEAS